MYVQLTIYKKNHANQLPAQADYSLPCIREGLSEVTILLPSSLTEIIVLEDNCVCTWFIIITIIPIPLASVFQCIIPNSVFNAVVSPAFHSA